MITFDPFWQLMKERGISVYALEYEIGLNPAEISRLKHDHNYTLRSIDRFCTLFQCQPGELLLHVTEADLKTLSDRSDRKNAFPNSYL